jgi:hypothetical protein
MAEKHSTPPARSPQKGSFAETAAWRLPTARLDLLGHQSALPQAPAPAAGERMMTASGLS